MWDESGEEEIHESLTSIRSGRLNAAVNQYSGDYFRDSTSTFTPLMMLPLGVTILRVKSSLTTADAQHDKIVSM